MKLIYAIVRDEDGSRVMEQLNKNGFSVTKLASTGGFLRSGNTTLIIGTEEQCGPRKQIVVNPVPIAGVGNYTSYPVSVDVGGATIFVMDVERFEKI